MAYSIRIDADFTEFDKKMEERVRAAEELERRFSGGGVSGTGGGGFRGILGENVGSSGATDSKVEQLNNRPGVGQKFADAIMSSSLRIGANGLPDLMPLITKVAAAFGPEGETVAKAIEVGSTLFTEGTKSVRSLSDVYWRTGGNAHEAGQVASIAAFTGKDPSQAVGDFVGSLNQPTYGAAIARSHGIYETPNRTDRAQTYLAGVKMLLNEPDEDKARRLARDLKLQDELGIRDMDASHKKRLLGDAANDVKPDEVATEANYRGDVAHLSGSWHKVERDFTKSLAGPVDLMLKGLDSAMKFGDLAYKNFDPIGILSNTNENWVNNHNFSIGAAIRGAYNGLVQGGRRLSDWLSGHPNKWEDYYGEYDQWKNGAKKTPDHVDSKNQSYRTTPGTVGGGERTAGAVPGNFKYEQVNQNIDAYVNRLGAY